VDLVTKEDGKDVPLVITGQGMKVCGVIVVAID
jgi:hypothetical protein